MSAKLLVNGVEITVPTSELGEAMRQLAPFMADNKSPAPAPLPEPRDPVFRHRVRVTDEPAEPAVDVDKGAILDFFKFLADHAVTGASTEEVMKPLRAGHIKGVGSRTATINKWLAANGFGVADAYTNEQDAMGVRTWRPGPRIREAIQKLSQT